MAIKHEAKPFFADYPDEARLANALDEAFDVTYRQNLDELSLWLLDPKTKVKERFGLMQEVLAIVSLHRKTDARVLTAIEKILRKPDFKHRVDKVLFFVIHAGLNEDTYALTSHSVDRVIVPIHAVDMLNPERGVVFIRSQIARAIGAIDLFGMTSAITSDKYFFGRNALVQSLINRAIVQRENSGLFGLRKTGKTSVLMAIQRRLEERPVLAVYFECSNPGIHSARWWSVLEAISNKLFEGAGPEARQKRPRREYSESMAGASFSDDIQTLLKDSGRANIFLMLDEIEFVTHGLSGALGQHWDVDFLPFWQTLRAVHQETGGALVFLVAGVNPACVEYSHFGETPNPIFQLATPHFLEPFSVAQVKEMVQSIGRYAGMDFQEDVWNYLHTTYGGHPFLTRIACSEVWRTADRFNPDHLAYVTKDDFDTRATEIRARLAPPIRDILLSLIWWYPEEYDLLRILASGDADFVKSYIQQEPRSIFRFAQYGVLRIDDPSTFAIADVREFLVNFGESYKRQLSPFSRSDVSPEFLPQSPDLPVLARLFEKRAAVEIKLRTAILLYLNVKYTFEADRVAKRIVKSLLPTPERPAPGDLFIGRTPQSAIIQLYCPDLKAIVLDNWEVFSPLFDGKKERFDMNMDTVNKARRMDAHVRSFTPEEIQDFENSYNWLLSRLAKIPTS